MARISSHCAEGGSCAWNGSWSPSQGGGDGRGATTMLAEQGANAAKLTPSGSFPRQSLPFSLMTNCRRFLSCSTWIWELFASNALAWAISAGLFGFLCWAEMATRHGDDDERVGAKHTIHPNQLWGHVRISQSGTQDVTTEENRRRGTLKNDPKRSAYNLCYKSTAFTFHDQAMVWSLFSKCTDA